MKKLALILVVNGFFLTNSVYAAPNDTPVTLAITGSVNSASQDCTVELSKNSIALESKSIESLPHVGVKQSTGVMNANFINLVGDNCDPSDNRFAIKFVGAADEGGKAFINTVSGDGAAQGIGISLYDYSGQPYTTNTDHSIFANNMPYYIGMVKFYDTTITAGQIQSSITVQLERL